ncbi:hypothetical protein GGQ97_001909 [Sphingomonas kaistensis]|uniref:Glycosyltransferase RgtA/B/C/D-like domain-containing protein n=1 Tax=Sphingomonas kaistensis TaxID=298708 RepID=A0A7X5Y9Q5_9SPHN|nr:hypothetical protein [Sphingomonas kaistensis]NJC06116.1 hypothetical protein [Sphingomonas kaistensis]
MHVAALAVLVGSWVAASMRLTVEPDEAWILLSTAETWGVQVPRTIATGLPTITTGGLHLITHGILALLSLDVLAHRMITIAASIALLFLGFRIFRAAGNDHGLALAGTVLLAATPGILLQASLALGEVMAFALLLASAAHWTWRGRNSASAALVTGLLFSLACATRINLLAGLGAFLLFVAVFHPGDWAKLRRAALALVVALVVNGAMTALHYWFGGGGLGEREAALLGAATGARTVRNLPYLLETFEVANQHFPFLLAGGIALVWLFRRTNPRSDEGVRANDLAALLIAVGGVMALAWLVRAPIPHLRYLWPATACLWTGGILVLLDWVNSQQKRQPRTMLHLLVAFAFVGSLASNVRALIVSDSSILAYQFMGMSPRYAAPHQAMGLDFMFQRKQAQMVANLPPSARIEALALETSMPIVLLSGRPLYSLDHAPKSNGGRFIVTTSADYRIWSPGPQFSQWRATHTRELFAAGGNALLQVDPSAPPAPQDRRSVGGHTW